MVDEDKTAVLVRLQKLLDESSRRERAFIFAGDYRKSEKMLSHWLIRAYQAYAASLPIRNNVDALSLCDKAVAARVNSLLYSLGNCVKAIDLYKRRTNFQNLFGPSQQDVCTRPTSVLQHLVETIRDPFAARKEDGMCTFLALHNAEFAAIGRFLETYGYGPPFRHSMKSLLPLLQVGVQRLASNGLPTGDGFTDAEIAAIRETK